ncbi:MAG: hypothetical protein AAB250_11475, partial [Bdellovibrionota bacterium]
VRFYDLGSSGNNFVAFRAPDAIAADQVWTLPSADGTSGQVLTTNGAGSMTWGTVSSSGGDFLRNGSLSMTGQFLAIGGSSLAPGIAFGGDTDTGLYNVGANTLALVTAGFNRMTIDSAGSIGVGTQAPTAALHLFGTSQAMLNLDVRSNTQEPQLSLRRSRNTAGADVAPNSGDKLGNLVFTGYNGVSFAQGARVGAVAAENFSGGALGSDLTFETVQPSTSSMFERMRITAGGNVGIGTTAPASGNRLEVTGGAIAAGSIGSGTGNGGQIRFNEIAAGGNYIALRAPDSIASNVLWTLPPVDGTVGQVMKTDGAGSLSWVTTGVGAGDFMRDGSLSMTGQFLSTVGSSLTPGISFGGDNDTGIFSGGANSIALSTGGLGRLYIDSSGFVGIGSTTPQTLLDVAGEAKVNGLSLGRGNTGNDTNTAFGVLASSSLTSGTDNVAIGWEALKSNTSVNYNTAVGSGALSSMVAGGGGANTALGFYALRGTTTGTQNTMMGQVAGQYNTTGSYNIAIGSEALRNNTAGVGNVVMGSTAGKDLNDASGTVGYNTLIGHDTGRGITTGGNNTIIGARVTGLPANLANNVIIADGQGNRRINVDSNGSVLIGASLSTAATNRLEVKGGAIAAGSIGSGTGNGGQVRFYDLGASGNNFVAFRAP